MRWIALAGLVLAGALERCPAADPVVLYASLDGTAKAADGNAPAGAERCRFVAAPFGKALVLDAAAARLQYPAAADGRRGAIALRFRMDRLPERDKPLPIAALSGPGSSLPIRLERNAYGSVLLAAGEYRTRLAKGEQAEALIGQWRHVTFTWTGTYLHWYVDGNELPTMLFARGDWETDRPITGRLVQSLQFGPRTLLQLADAGGAIAIADLGVYGSALSPEQAGALARAQRAGRIETRPGVVVDALWGPGPRRVDVIVDVAPAGLEPTSVLLSAVNLVDGNVAGQAIASFHAGQAVACFDVPRLGSGQWVVRAELRGQAGEAIAQGQSRPWHFDAAKYPWLWNQVGLGDTVPPPWSPVRAEGTVAEVWGRSYRLGDLALPDSMVSAGQEMLAGPIVISGESSDGPLPWQTSQPVRWTRAEPRRAVATAKARAGGVLAEIQAEVEFDGLITYTLALRPADGNRPQIRSLRLEVPLRPDRAVLMRALGHKGFFAALTPSGEGRVWDDSFLRQGPVTAPAPFIWLGDDDRGLSWSWDDDRGCPLDLAKPNLEVFRKDGRVLLRVHLVNQSLVLGGPRRIRFTLMASPVRPLPSGWRATEFAGQRVLNGPHYKWWWPGKTSPGRRVEGWEGFLPYGVPEDEARQYARRCHADGIAVLPFLNAHATGGMPKAEFWEELRRFPEGGLVYQNQTRAFQDFNLYHLDRWSRGEGAIDGIYMDESYICGPEVNPLGGMGYYDGLGRARAGYGIELVRQYFRRLYIMFQANGRAGLIWQHAKAFHIPRVLSFTGATLEGENFAARYDDDYIDNLLKGEPKGVDYLPRLSRLRASCRSINSGVIGTYALYTSPAHDPNLTAQHAAVMGLCDILPVQEPAAFRAAKLEFDIGANDVSFHPFWADPLPVRTAPEGVLVSSYRRPGRQLLYVVNSLRKPLTATIELPAEEAKPPGRRIAYDSFTRETFPLTQGDRLFSVPLPAHGFRLIQIAPPPADRAPAGICFAANFEGNLAATHSRGSSYGRASDGNLAFDEGHTGRGLVLGRNQGLVRYLAADNVPGKAGTLTFWIRLRRKPPPWFQFLSVPSSGQLDLGLMDGRPIVLNLSAAGWHATSKPAREPWVPGQWHHVAVTWNGPVHLLYLDGLALQELSLEGKTLKPPPAHPAWIVLGSTARQNDLTSDLVIDELRLYDHCLDANAVAKLATAQAD